MKKGLISLCVWFVTIFFVSNICASEKNDFEKIQKQESLVFVILANADAKSDYLWHRCYDSIREFYPDEKIVVIDDHSLHPISGKGLVNLTVIENEFVHAGELAPYYYYSMHKWADKMVVLKDSMYLLRKFTSKEIKQPVKFHWCFTEHNWDEDDSLDYYLSQLNEAESLIDFNHTKEWWGCYESASIISLNVLEFIENKYEFCSRLTSLVNSEYPPVSIERLFAILMFKEKLVNFRDCCNFGTYVSIYHYNSENTKDWAILKTFKDR